MSEYTADEIEQLATALAREWLPAATFAAIGESVMLRYQATVRSMLAGETPDTLPDGRLLMHGFTWTRYGWDSSVTGLLAKAASLRSLRPTTAGSAPTTAPWRAPSLASFRSQPWDAHPACFCGGIEHMRRPDCPRPAEDRASSDAPAFVASEAGETGPTVDGLLHAALQLHAAGCEACGGPDDGCEIGQGIEHAMLEVNPRAYDVHGAPNAVSPRPPTADGVEGWYTLGWVEDGDDTENTGVVFAAVCTHTGAMEVARSIRSRPGFMVRVKVASVAVLSRLLASTGKDGK